MNKRRTHNPKRKIRTPIATDFEKDRIEKMVAHVTYTGNPSHKKNPGDFKLTPPSQPREGKTLCDGAGIVERSVARGLLKAGLQRGLVSEQERNGWPQYIWAVHKDGTPVEAILENSEIGSYHGYPLQQDDPFREQVLTRWLQK